MKIIFGFGKIEEKQREQTFKDIENIIRKIIVKYKNQTRYFTDEMFAEFKKEFKKYTKKIQKKYDKIESKPPKERPERYYHISYGQRIAYDLDCIFVAIKFWHINCRHPLSPDGIALLNVKDCRAFYYEDLYSNKINK